MLVTDLFEEAKNAVPIQLRADLMKAFSGVEEAYVDKVWDPEVASGEGTQPLCIYAPELRDSPLMQMVHDTKKEKEAMMSKIRSKAYAKFKTAAIKATKSMKKYGLIGYAIADSFEDQDLKMKPLAELENEPFDLKRDENLFFIFDDKKVKKIVSKGMRIALTFTPDDEREMMKAVKKFKGLSAEAPQWIGPGHMSVGISGLQADLIKFLTDEDNGAGYSFNYIRKIYPDLFT